MRLLKGILKFFQNLSNKYLIKYYIIQKGFCLKMHFFLFLANFISIVSHLKIHQTVHLNTSKTLDVIVIKKKSLLKVH